MPQPPTPARPRLDSLTSLRFLAAFAVLLYHVRTRWLGHALALGPTWLDQVLAGGYVAVGFFFMLSGFVLVYGYGKPGPFELDRKNFWSARFARIYPVFLLGLAVGAVPALMEYHRGSSWAAAVGTFAWTGAVNLALLPAFSNEAGAWNTPAWSLSAEAFFYLAFPWLMAAVWKLSRRQLGLALFACAGLALLVPGLWCALDPTIAAWKADRVSFGEGYPEVAMTLLSFGPLGRVFDFVMGVILGKLYLDRTTGLHETSPLGGRLEGGLLLGAFAVCFLTLAQSARIPHVVLCNGLLNLPFALIIYLLALAPARWGALLRHPWAILLGESSYALYILHVPVRDWCLGLNRRLGLPELPLFAGYAVFMVALSILVFSKFEQPMRQRILAAFESRPAKRFPS